MQLLCCEAGVQRHRPSSSDLVTWCTLAYIRAHDFGPHKRGKTKAWGFIIVAPLFQNEVSLQ